MITTKHKLREAISLYRKRYGNSIKNYIKGLILKSDASHAIRLLTILRKTEYYFNNKDRNVFYKILHMLYYIKYHRIQYKYDTYIAINCCKPGLWIPHVGDKLLIVNQWAITVV